MTAIDEYEQQAGVDMVAISEHAVLGSALRSSAVAQEAAATLAPHHFRETVHQVVFEAVLRLADAGEPVEPASVMSELNRTGMLMKIRGDGMGTGGAFLHSLMERAGSVGYHAPRVLAGWLQRNARDVLRSCEAITLRPDFDPDMHLDEIRKRVEDATAFAGTTVLRPNSETVNEVLEEIEQGIDPGLSTGYPDLDDAIGGLRPSELIIVGARPAVGKTLLAGGIADHVGSHLNLPVLFSSLEMKESELTMRRISAAAKVPLHHLVRHQVSDAEWDQICRAHGKLLETQLHIDDTPQQSLAHIRGRLRAMTRTGNAARLLIIDYLGFMDTPKAESRQQAVAELARGVKNVAREFDIPAVLLAQLNRGPEARSDKRPVSSDLRESGEIEQTADIVLLLHREDVYERESPRAGEVDVLVTKNRQGPLTTVTLCFQGHYGRIVSMAADWSPSSVVGGAA